MVVDQNIPPPLSMGKVVRQSQNFSAIEYFYLVMYNNGVFLFGYV